MVQEDAAEDALRLPAPVGVHLGASRNCPHMRCQLSHLASERFGHQWDFVLRTWFDDDISKVVGS